MSDTDKPGDPADKIADGAFGGVQSGIQSHRAGYGDDKLARIVDFLRRNPSATLASGEGALLLAEIERLRGYYGEAVDEIGTLRDDLHTQADWADWANGEIDRLRAAAKDSADHYADARAEIDRLRVRNWRLFEDSCDCAQQIEIMLAGKKDAADRYAEARAEIDRLTAAIARVRALHEPIAKDIPKCVTCKDYSGYHIDLPCPTLRALDGDA